MPGAIDARKVGRSIDGPLGRITPDPYRRLRAAFENCGRLTGSDLMLAYQADLLLFSTRSFGRVLPCVLHFFPCNSHRYSSHPAYDFSLSGVIKSPNILVGVRVGNYDQLTSIHLAPTANVTFSEFEVESGRVARSQWQAGVEPGPVGGAPGLDDRASDPMDLGARPHRQ